MSITRRILFVPLGPASYIDEHLHRVSEIAQELSGHLTLLGVVPPLGEVPTEHLQPDERAFLLERAVGHLSQMMTPWITRLAAPGNAELIVEVGRIEDLVHDLTFAGQSDLVVVMPGPTEATTTTVQRIVASSNVSVLVLQPQAKASHVLAALDVAHPNEINRAIIGGARLLARTPNGILAANCAELFEHQPSLETDDRLVFDDDSLDRPMRARAVGIESSLLDAHRRALHQLTGLEQVVLEGQPARQLPTLVGHHQIGLVVIGAGRAAYELGSVTAELITRLTTSILVARPTAPEQSVG